MNHNLFKKAQEEISCINILDLKFRVSSTCYSAELVNSRIGCYHEVTLLLNRGREDKGRNGIKTEPYSALSILILIADNDEIVDYKLLNHFKPAFHLLTHDYRTKILHKYPEFTI